MKRRVEVLSTAAILLGAVAWAAPSAAQTADAPIAVRTKKAAYDDVKFELTNAIINRGLVVDFNGQISKMLERTGADVGSAKPIFKQAEYFTFCSAKLSRQMMEADPLSVGFCPYVVFVYETAGSPGTTHVGFRRLPLAGSIASKTALGEINTLLEGIVAEAVK